MMFVEQQARVFLHDGVEGDIIAQLDSGLLRIWLVVHGSVFP